LFAAIASGIVIMRAESKGGTPMRRSPCALLFLSLLLSAAIAAAPGAEPIRVAVIDFTVQSDNPAYKYLGKGFAEFSAIELAKSRDVLLIEREKRNKALEELAFSLSDVADEAKQLKVGEFLSAQYLIGGSIFELAGKLVVTVQVLDIEKGSTAFADKVSAEPEAYDFIIASLASKVLSFFNLQKPTAVVAKTEKPARKPVEAAVRFSNAVDALDRKDVEAARVDLSAARNLDPESDAIRLYLSRLTVNTTKFQITTEPYFSFQNPAYLGVIKADRLYLSVNMPASTFSDAYLFNGSGAVPTPHWNGIGLPEGNGFEAEGSTNGRLGYQVPLGKRMGIDIEGFFFVMQDTIWDTTFVPAHQTFTNMVGGGGIIGIGYSLSDHLSVGLGLAPYFSVMDSSFQFAGNAGVLYSSERVLVDSRIGYSTGTRYWIDPVTLALTTRKVGAPLYNENTFTWVSANRKLFLIVKQTNEIPLETLDYFTRLLPAVEFFFSNRFSLRAGIEGSFGYLDGTPQFGFGGELGTTYRFLPLGLDFDLNAAYWLRPSRNVPGLLYPSFTLLAGVGYNGLFSSYR
jgi:TolB-like protein